MFKGTLYKTQKEAAEKLVNRRQMLIGWEQGTGKTIITLAAVEMLFALKKANNALIIVPTSLTWQWGDKIKEFTDSPVRIVSAKHNREYTPIVHGYVVVPYSLFRRDFNLVSKGSWDIIVADEAQEFRNFSSVTARLIKRSTLVRSSIYRWALTGTAIGNKLEELYSIMQWIDKDLLGSWPTFEKNHIVRNHFGIIESYKNLNSLHDYLKSTKLDRKTHKDMEGQMPILLPPIIHKIEQSKENLEAQKNLLKHLEDLAGDIYVDSNGEIKGVRKDSKVAKAFHEVKLTLFSDHKLRYTEQLIESILAENPTNKVVAFSFYKEPLYKLHDKLTGSVLFTGDHSTDEKRRNIKALESGQARCLLSSNAGKAGLDLSTVNYVIHLDVPFSHEVNDQRTKRITRASSVHKTAVVHYIIMEDSIEEFYREVLLNKSKLASAVLEGTEDSVATRPSSLRQFLGNGKRKKSKSAVRSGTTDKDATKKSRPVAKRTKGRTHRRGRSRL